ncbi:hypothetical protein DFH29DRAFT_1004788 [Suillus ampliporus]|nr:hypothetical protein DFH29DRAFT_1004788 [Suillus ampliporus]
MKGGAPKEKTSTGKPGGGTLGRPGSGPKSGRTTANMGLTLTHKPADDAVDEEVKHSRDDMHKPIRKLKLEDLPFADKKDIDIWARFICALIDWAGTTTDPFGTNEHPDLSTKLQELWDVLFPHNKVEVAKCLAIKKVATDRLNKWQSMLGRKAIKILEHELRKEEYKTDITTRVQFIQALLPHKIDSQKCVPFIYLDPENLKGSWLGPMLLELLTTHAKRCGTSFKAFGKPVGVLGMCAAADGESAKEAAKDAKRSGITSIPAKNVAFDAAWGSLANQYSVQTVKLPEKKWDQVLDGMWELVGNDSLWSRVPMTDGGDDDLMDICDAIPLSDDEDFSIW